MSTIPAKVCILCKQDCSKKPRLRDPQGRYTCEACANEAEAKAAAKKSATAPPPPPPDPEEPDLSYALEEEQKVAAPLAADTASCMGCGVLMPPGALICTHCGFDTRTGAPTKTSKKEKRGPKRCEKCGYDLTGLKKPKCPECGHVFTLGRDLKKERAEDNRQTIRWAYIKPLITIAAGLALMCIIAASRGGEAYVIGYLIKYAAGFPIAAMVFWICCLMWVGFDAPLHLMLLRMAGVCAVTDAAAAAVDGLPLYFVTRAFIMIVFVGTLTDAMEMDMTDALIVGVITWLAKVMAVLAIIAYMMPQF
jgi:hypothetical protein